jgi:hypothetical protein
MAYTAGNLHLRAGAPGDLTYTYDAGSDSMATVATAGYFNNTDDDLNLTVDDLVWCQCTDGNMWLRVASISSGSVTAQFAGGNLPLQTFSTGTAAALNTLAVGYYEVGTSVATASRNVLPTPYAGAEVHVTKQDSGTQVFHFDAGGSGATGVTYDGSNRRIILRQEGESFHVVGTSATRWRIMNINHHASAISQGASVVMPGT